MIFKVRYTTRQLANNEPSFKNLKRLLVHYLFEKYYKVSFYYLYIRLNEKNMFFFRKRRSCYHACKE
jgi:hypothetical protein